MDTPIRKTMQDVIKPVDGGSGVRRTQPVLDAHPYAENIEESNVNIAENPFFEKKKEVRSPFLVEKQASSRVWLWVLVVVVFLGASIAVISRFSSATVDIVTLNEMAVVDREFIAEKDTTTGALAFQSLSLTEERSRNVPATLEQRVQRKAKGKVLIYNGYSPASQRLLINTRLESPDHKIFRIEKSITVPGTKIIGGKVVPGSIEVTVYADIPGADHNIGLADFTIPGFKGDPRYAKFTARSKPDSPISGGFSGMVKVPTDQDVVAAQTALRDELKEIVVGKARAQVPATDMFFPGSMVLKFEEVPRDFSATSTTVAMRATVSVFFFDTALLTKQIAESSIKDYRGGVVTIANPQALTFSFLDSVNNVVLSDIDKIRFSLKGGAQFVWNVDADALRNALAGKNKDEFAKVIADVSHVKKADASIFPFWNAVFPSDAKKIVVKVSDK